MSLRKRMQELAIEQEAIAEAAAEVVEPVEVSEDVVDTAEAVENLETTNQEVQSDVEASEEAEVLEEEIDTQVEANNEVIEAEAEPTDAQVVAAEMHLKHFAYRAGMIDSIATESIKIGGSIGEIAFEGYDYVSTANREKLRNVNLALEAVKEQVGDAKFSIMGTIKKWIEAIKNFFKSIFSGTFRAYKYIKENKEAVKKALSGADVNSDNYKEFAKKWAGAANKLAKDMFMDEDKKKLIAEGKPESFSVAMGVIDYSVNLINELKNRVTQIQESKDNGYFDKVFAEYEARWKKGHNLVAVLEGDHLKPETVAKNIDALLNAYEKLSGGMANKVVSGASFICEKVQAGLSKVGSQEGKRQNQINRNLYNMTRAYTKSISAASSAINLAIVAIAGFVKKAGKAAEGEAAPKAEEAKAE